jgi:hypothetical protein
MRIAVEPPHIVSACEGTPARSVPLPSGKEQRSWIGWVPLTLLPMMAMMLRTKLLPWAFMWLLAVAIFAGCKWQTWWQARAKGDAGNWNRSAAYFLLWPGMEAREFFAVAGKTRSTPVSAWLWGIAKALAGIVLTWAGARVVALGHPLVGGWTGMVGLVLFLHFGTFHLIALAWQRAGVRVKPIMQRPLASRSLSELWGKRWNLGFRKLTHTWVFLPLQKRFGSVAGTLGAFLASGLLHDLVISVPAGAGYGLPTAYFLVQGLGVIAERSESGKRVGLGRGARGWLWTALIAAAPLYWLFHPWFVMQVMVPFLRAVVG